MVRVEPMTLRAKAAQLDEPMPTLPEPPRQADGTQIASDALTRLTSSADKLRAYAACGQQEAKRLSASYQAAADAYLKVDEVTSAALADGENAPKIEPVPVNPNLPARMPLPAHMGGTSVTPTASFVEVKQAAQQLEQPDQAQSLSSYADSLKNYADLMSSRALTLSDTGMVWDGQAAEAANDALTKHRDWVIEMAKAALKLAESATSLADAHKSAKSSHPTVEQCQELEQQIIWASSRGLDPSALLAQYHALQTASEEVQSAYASGATIQSVDAPQPPSGAPHMGQVGHNDPRVDAKKMTVDPNKGQPGGSAGSGGGSGGGGAGAGGGAPQGGPAQAPDTASVSPMSTEQPKSGGESSGGSPSGGSPSGGSPSGGSPSGGSGSGGGLPSLPGGDPSGMPSLPDDPGLNPAAAGGGGSGGGGAGGGGIGAMRLQPAASGPAVGTGPSGGGAAGAHAPAAGGGPGGGGMAGGGGMGPMGGHGQGGGGKERKRTPSLAPDEVIYTEDREWTENYIGQQAKRRPSADGKDNK